jgi:hypothetical protein
MEKEFEVKGIIQMLKSISDTAEHSSLTGALKNGVKSAQQSYNRILQRLHALDLVSEELFSPLPAESTFDEIGLAAAQLSAFLKGALGIEKRAGVANRDPGFISDVLKSILGENSAQKDNDEDHEE